MLTAAERAAYGERVSAMSDAEYEDEVVKVTDAGARTPIYCTWDQMADVLLRERDRRPCGHALYEHGHRRMRAGVAAERAFARTMEAVGHEPGH